MENLTFDELREGDIIDNFEVYEIKDEDGKTIDYAQDDETYYVLYDKYNSSVDSDCVIVEVTRNDERLPSRSLRRKEFEFKKMKAYRE
jgi:hypothetical protein